MNRHTLVAVVLSHLLAAAEPSSQELAGHAASPRPGERVRAFQLAVGRNDQALARALLAARAGGPSADGREVAILGQLASQLPDTDLVALLRAPHAVPAAAAEIALAGRPLPALRALLAPLLPQAEDAFARRLAAVVDGAARLNRRTNDPDLAPLLAWRISQSGGERRGDAAAGLSDAQLTLDLATTALADADPAVRTAMAARLSYTDGPIWRGDLGREVLTRDDRPVILALAKAGLVILGVPRNDDAALCERLIADADPTVRAAAVVWAAAQPALIATPAVLTLLGDQDASVRRATAASGAWRDPAVAARLLALAREVGGATVGAALTGLERLDHAECSAVAEALAGAARTPAAERRLALDVLTRREPTRAAALAGPLLDSPDPALRSRARALLTDLAPLDQVAGAVAVAMDGDGGQVRATVVRLLTLPTAERTAEIAKLYPTLPAASRRNFATVLRATDRETFDTLARSVVASKDAVTIAELVPPIPNEGREPIADLSWYVLVRALPPEQAGQGRPRDHLRRLAKDYPSLDVEDAPSAQTTNDRALRQVVDGKSAPVDRAAAALTLAHSDDAGADKALATALNDADLGVRCAARVALLRRGSADPAVLDHWLAQALILMDNKRIDGLTAPADAVATRARLDGFAKLAPKERIDDLRTVLDYLIVAQAAARTGAKP